MQQFEGGDSVRPLHGLGAISRTARVQQSVFRPQYKQDRWVLTNLEEGARVHQASFFQTVDLKKQGQNILTKKVPSKTKAPFLVLKFAAHFVKALLYHLVSLVIGLPQVRYHEFCSGLLVI